MRRMLFAIGTLLVATAPAHAVEIGNFPGLETLIDKADAIVILRIDCHIQPNNDKNLLSTHECFICQSLKGPIPADERIQLRLMDTANCLFDTIRTLVNAPHDPDKETHPRRAN